MDDSGTLSKHVGTTRAGTDIRVLVLPIWFANVANAGT